MPSPLSVLQDLKIVQSLQPATDAAGRTGDYANAKLAARIYAKFHIDQGNAATISCSLMQAKDAAGTGAKAITALMPIQVSEDLAAASGDVLAAQAAAASYVTGAGVKRKQVIIEIDPLLALDYANGFTWIALKTGASNVANLTEGEVILTGLRYHGNPPPSARI